MLARSSAPSSLRTPRAIRFVVLALISTSLGVLPGCTTLATSPDHVGGTLATGALERAEREDAALEATAKAIAREPKSIRARHLLVMHEGSERKPPSIKRARAEAKARAEEALAAIQKGTPFEQVVARYSDEPGAAERGGDLDRFEKKDMTKAFSDAAFRLAVGEVSDVVETQFGFHVIQRTE